MDSAIFAHYCGLHKSCGEDLLYLAQRTRGPRRYSALSIFHCQFSIFHSFLAQRTRGARRYSAFSIVNFQFISRTEDAGRRRYFAFSIFHFQFISRTEYAEVFVTLYFRLHAFYVKKRTQPASAGWVRDTGIRGLVRATTGLALHFGASAPLAGPAGQQ